MGKKIAEISVSVDGMIGKEKVEEVFSTAHFFGHCGHIYVGMAITHRKTGLQLGHYQASDAKAIINELEKCGVNWNFAIQPKPRTKANRDMYLTIFPILNAYKRTDGIRWKTPKQLKVKA